MNASEYITMVASEHPSLGTAQLLTDIDALEGTIAPCEIDEAWPTQRKLMHVRQHLSRVCFALQPGRVKRAHRLLNALSESLGFPPAPGRPRWERVDLQAALDIAAQRFDDPELAPLFQELGGTLYRLSEAQPTEKISLPADRDWGHPQIAIVLRCCGGYLSAVYHHGPRLVKRGHQLLNLIRDRLRMYDGAGSLYDIPAKAA